MAVADKLTQIANNVPLVYDAGYQKGIAEGGDTTAAYNRGVADGKQAEYDAFWDGFQLNGNRKVYCRAFSGCCWTQEALEGIKYPISINETGIYQGFAKGMFSYLNWGVDRTTPFDMTNILSKIDFTNCVVAESLFANSYVEKINIRLPNVQNINTMFGGGDSGGFGVDNVTLFITEKCTILTNAFSSATRLSTLIFAEGSTIAGSISFAQSNKLTAESVQSIINALMTITDGVARTITFHATVKNNLTDEQIATITTTKGWTLA